MPKSEPVTPRKSSHHRSPWATPADLPNELIQEIINHLSPTKAFKITSLSLISRSWFLYLRSSCSYARFTCIHLHSRNVLQFLALLESPLCSFRSNVRQLYFDLIPTRTLEKVQRRIHGILTNPAILYHNQTHNQHSNPYQAIVKEYITKILTPGVKECHLLNIVGLFPRLEHLEVQLMSLKSYAIPKFPAQPPVSSTLNSITILCNSSPPKHSLSKMGAYIPPEWKRFFGWIHSNKIYTIRRLYLIDMRSWNYRAAETFVKLQGTALKHLHLGFGDYNPSQYHKSLNIDSELDSLHIEVIDPGMSVIAADILSAVPPDNITIIGLDIGHKLVRQATEVQNLVRAFKTRQFSRLARIRVRMEYDIPIYSFTVAAQILHKAFLTDMLTVESIPYEKRYLLRDPTDDCARCRNRRGTDSTESLLSLLFSYRGISGGRGGGGGGYTLDDISHDWHVY